MFETLINQGRELLGIKPRVSKVAAERRKSVVTTQNKTAVPVTRGKTSPAWILGWIQSHRS